MALIARAARRGRRRRRRARRSCWPPASTTPSCATTSSPCWPPATRRRRARWPGRWSASRAPRRVLARVREGDEAWIDGVVKETLRIRPVLTVAPRKLAAPLHVDGLELPAGVHVAPCIYLVHRREDLYPDARTWRPERWLGARTAGVLRVDPVRRRRAPLPGRGLRDDGDGRGPARRRASASTSPRRRRAASACAGAASRCSPAAARASCSATLARLLRLDRLGGGQSPAGGRPCRRRPG